MVAYFGTVCFGLFGSFYAFYCDGSLVVLVGEPPAFISFTSFPQFMRLFAYQSVASVHVVSMFPDEDIVATLPADLATLLHHFTAVFALPQGWSSHRFHAQCVSSKFMPLSLPSLSEGYYGIPHCGDVLDSLIRPSISPYSSLVLLVKKKDGSWRFSTDYQALNAIAVKDHFSIPTIDE
ncbi:UNVERIFIED_CONTAM: hypothetical protein Scaly_2438300 [Sesamum calycinum]|uniref:Uncharacterized protein n=1 Tax=Sesamum calycinum TaxID=2727403 RepID=A0AAW2M109_9LAMI